MNAHGWAGLGRTQKPMGWAGFCENIDGLGWAGLWVSAHGLLFIGPAQPIRSSGMGSDCKIRLDFDCRIRA